MFDVIFTPEGYFIDEVDEIMEKERGAAYSFLKSYKEDRIKAIYDASFVTEPKSFGPGLKFLYNVSETFVRKIIREPFVEFKKGNAEFSLSHETAEKLLIRAPYTQGSENITEDWLAEFWNQILRVYNRETSEYEGSVASYISGKNNDLAVADRIYFHLVENTDPEYPFAFLATYSAPKKQGRKTFHTPLEYALDQYKDDLEKLVELLSTVIKVSKESRLISGLLDTGEFFKAIGFTAEEAGIFLKEVPLYEEYGIVCRIPNWWKKKGNGLESGFVIDDGSGNNVSLESLITFKPVIFLNGELITKEELLTLIDEPEGLFRFKGQWVNISHEHIKDLLEVIEENKDGFTRSISDLLSGQFKGKEETEDDTLMQREFLYRFRKNIENLQKREPRPVPETLNATLREYQEEGFRWLSGMENMGFGYCLADDMGLGKTVQVLALLESDRQQAKTPSLLILPASLMSNWENEIEKFLPNYKYRILHTSNPDFDRENFIDNNIPLYITTYGMVKKIPELSDIGWHMIILDEAQAIKNPGTAQTKAVKSLKGDVRIAMTGTPLENNPGDLWSLFDFLNPGLLGNKKEFKSFAKDLKKDETNIVTLRKTVSPFILRRLKTDKTIIEDLPDKIEIKDYVDLTAKQAAAYTRVCNRLEESLTDAEGIERRGMVLAAITALKQICNHPSQYMGKSDYKVSESGKMAYLAELSKTISEKHERLLVFTQYAEIIPYLDEVLEGVFGKPGLTLSGNTPVKKRGEIVDLFNSKDEYIPYAVLSLKAGGTGLNLTGANHVIHFDRWWNPAVENQATDRAYRIGQTKDVIVRKLITRGTLEEKIDGIIYEKKNMAEDILGVSGGKSLTEMNNDELMAFIRLQSTGGRK